MGPANPGTQKKKSTKTHAVQSPRLAPVAQKCRTHLRHFWPDGGWEPTKISSSKIPAKGLPFGSTTN